MSEEVRVDILLVLYANQGGVWLSDLRQAFLRHHGRPLALPPSALRDLLEEMMADTIERRVLGGRERLLALGAAQARAAAGPRALDAAGPWALDVARPRALDAAGPRALDAARPWVLDAAGPWVLDAAGPRALDAAGPRALDAARPRALDAARPRALDAARPRALDAARPRALDAARPWALDAARPRAHIAARPQAQVAPSQQSPGLPARSWPKNGGPPPTPSCREAREPGPASWAPGWSESPRGQAARPLTYSQALQGWRRAGERPPTPGPGGVTPRGTGAPESPRQCLPSRAHGTRDGGELVQWVLGVLQTKGYRDGIQVKKLARIYWAQTGRDLSDLLGSTGSPSLQDFLAELPDVELVRTERAETNTVVRLRPHAKGTSWRPTGAAAAIPQPKGGDGAIAPSSETGGPGSAGARGATETGVTGPRPGMSEETPPAPAASHAPLPEAETPEQIRHNLLLLLRRHPEGMSLFDLRRLYTRTHGRPLDPLQHVSVKDLLQSMSGQVTLRGFGVQTRIYPYSTAEASHPATCDGAEDGGIALCSQRTETETSGGDGQSEASALGLRAAGSFDGGWLSVLPGTGLSASCAGGRDAPRRKSPPDSKPRPVPAGRRSPGSSSRRRCVTLPPLPAPFTGREVSQFWPSAVSLTPWTFANQAAVGPNLLLAPSAYPAAFLPPPGPGHLAGLGPNPRPRPSAYPVSFSPPPGPGHSAGLDRTLLPKPAAYSPSFSARVDPSPTAYSTSPLSTASPRPGFSVGVGLGPQSSQAAYPTFHLSTASPGPGFSEGVGLRRQAHCAAYLTSPAPGLGHEAQSAAWGLASREGGEPPPDPRRRDAGADPVFPSRSVQEESCTLI